MQKISQMVEGRLLTASPTPWEKKKKKKKKGALLCERRRDTETKADIISVPGRLQWMESVIISLRHNEPIETPPNISRVTSRVQCVCVATRN